jgi:chorismate lyase / 3-hydroxybenzoate synthase
VTVAARSKSAQSAADLVFARLCFDESMALDKLLGARLLGAPSGSAAGPEAAAVSARLLFPAHAVLDAWSSGGPLTHGESGCVHFSTDGTWMHGCAEIDDHSLEGGIQAAAYRLYADLFAVLDASETPHLLRLWNYLADINRDGDSMERYRHFNIGRQQAFLEADRSVLENSPAACALGTHGGPLRVYFLAGRQAPQAIENPRQVSAYHYPDEYGPRSPTFSRAALAEVGGDRQALFISGTASIVGHTSVHVGDVRKQTEESLVNIAALRQVAGARAQRRFETDDLIYTVYVRDAADFGAVREVFERHVGPGSAAAREAVYLHADICRSDLLVEVEAHGFAAAEAKP